MFQPLSTYLSFLLSEGMTRAKNELARNEDFVKLYSQLESMFSDTAVTSANGNHPNIGWFVFL